MGDYDLRLDIPWRAIVNLNLLDLVEKGESFLGAKKHFSQQHPEIGLDPYEYTLNDQVLAITLLYCTVVVPREILDLPCNHSIYRDFDAEGITRFFNISKPRPIDSYTLIRSLRNSVAHALFSIKQSSDGVVQYDFWTEREPVFQATTTGPALRQFNQIVGLSFTNAVLRMKTGELGRSDTGPV